MKRVLLIGLLTCALSSCAIFRSTMPDYVRYHGDGGEWGPGMDHPDVWAANLHTSMRNKATPPVTHADWAIDGAVYGVGEAAKEIDKLEKEGAKFKVAVNAAGKFSFEIFKPASAASVAEGVVAKLLPFSSKEDYVAIMLNNVGRGAKQLSNDSIPEIEALYFATVTELEEIKGGKELSFKLPDGLTRENYVELLDCLLMSFHNDYQQVMDYQAVLASTLAAVASLDSSNRGGVGNLYLVLEAALKDRERFESRRKSLESYPPPNLPELRAEAAKVYASAHASPRYKAWLNEPHALNKMANFGSAVVDAFASLSEVYGAMGGVDIVGNIQEKVAAGMTLDTMLDVGLKLAPQGSRLRTILDTGKNAYSTADSVNSAISDPGAAAGASATKLILWAAPEDVEQARQRITALQKPEH